MIKIICILFIIIIKHSSSLRCIENQNFCLKCNIETHLCAQCTNKGFMPDNQGGCTGIKKCIIGNNYCNMCNEEGNICQDCEIGFFPDNNGGCSYMNNCEISYKGLCFQCKDDFILIRSGEGYQFCKSIYSSDLKNCKVINKENGNCKECENGFFLDEGDFKCTKTENCYESIFGICNKCKDGYYLDKKNDACFLKENKFNNCQESFDGENCEICDNNYFLSEDLYCIKTDFCYETKDYSCIKCIKNYFLSENGKCSTTDNCKLSDGENGVCKECLKEYYLDIKDGKCKLNEIEEEYKFCLKVNEFCIECISGYYIGEDNKCSTTQNCAESDNGICLSCSNNYILINDNKCIDIQNCAYVNDKYECIECKENYLLINKTCKIIEDEKFENCKMADNAGKICTLCKDDFYLNKTNNLCYSNKEYGKFYKCKYTSDANNICAECLPGYYLGYEDRKCTHTVACVSSDQYNQCYKCDSDYFCLNLLNHTCEQNEYISNEDKMIYYKCIMTNENGTKCKDCKESFEIGENEYCFNNYDCLKKEDGICIKCKEKNIYNYELCLNKYFGCVETSVKNCLRCDDPLDTESCTECYEGFHLTKNNNCEPKEDY